MVDVKEMQITLKRDVNVRKLAVMVSSKRRSLFEGECVDCDFVACLVNPCEVIECPAFPNAECVPNFCTGCDADFFVNGRLVDCGTCKKNTLHL